MFPPRVTMTTFRKQWLLLHSYLADLQQMSLWLAPHIIYKCGPSSAKWTQSMSRYLKPIPCVCQNNTEHSRHLAADESHGFLPERSSSQLCCDLFSPVKGRAHCPGRICTDIHCVGPPLSIMVLRLISCYRRQGLLGFL